MIPNSGYAETNLRTLSFVKHFFAVIYKTLNLCKILDTFLQVRIVTNADLLKALICISVNAMPNTKWHNLVTLSVHCNKRTLTNFKRLRDSGWGSG